jgi:Ca2+-binding EF-hand superfamily protein
MKTSSVSLALLTAALLAVSARAQAEKIEMGPTEAKPEADRMKQSREELIKRFDKNGDGKLDEDEKAAAHKAMRMEGGGYAGRQKEILRRFDKNGDGRLDDGERAEAEKARELVEKNGGMGRFRELVLKRFDLDGDGKLNEAERAAAAKFRAEQLKKFDKDGDGQLNDAERAEALKAFMAEERATPGPAAAPTPTPGK